MRIILRDVCKRYNDKCVLNGLSLEFSSERRYAVVGASGIGKTTLLRVIAGLEIPDGGSVIAEDPVWISYAFQEPRLFPELTVAENIAAIDPDREAGQILRMLDLEKEADSYPDALSGGMKKRAALARALSKQADIYLIDEPTAGQDAYHSAAIAQALRTYTEGCVCIVSTHDAELIANLADEMIVFRSDGIERHDVNDMTAEEIRTFMQ